MSVNARICRVLALISLLSIGFWQAGVAAEESMSFSPALFEDDGKTFGDRIRFPAVKTDIYLRIRCHASADERGNLVQNVCFDSGNQNKVFIDAIYRAARRAELTPALVNGERVRVWFQYTIVFEKTDDTRNVNVFHHHFHNESELGLHYSSAQRYELIPREGACIIGAPFVVWVLSVVDENGHVQQVLDTQHEVSHEACANDLEDIVLNRRYIPAFKDGRPVPSIHLQAFFSNSFSKRLDNIDFLRSRSPRLL